MPIDFTDRVTETAWDSYGAYLEKVWESALVSMEVASRAFFGITDIWADLQRRNPGMDFSNRGNFNPGIFAAKVEQAVSSQLTLVPHYHREPVGVGQSHEDKTGSLEKGLSAVVENAFTAASNFPTIENGKQIFLFNYTQRGVLLDLDRLIKPKQKKGEDKEDFQQREWEWRSQKQHWNPLKYVVPTPGEVLMEPFETSPGISIWRKDMPAYELADLTLTRLDRKQRDRPGVYRESQIDVFDLGKRDAYEILKVEEWWTPRWTMLREKGGKILISERNHWGIQPFSQVWAGNAISPVGETFDLKWWVEQAMMFKSLPTLMMYAQSKWARHEVLMRTAGAPYVYEGDPSELARGLQDKVLPVSPDDVSILVTPQLAAQAYQEEADLVRSLDAITFSPLAAGIRENEAETATGVQIRAENVSKAFKAMVTKLAHLEAESGSNTMKLVYKTSEVLGEDYQEIGIGRNKLRVKDMEGQFHIQASFESVNSIVAIQELQRGKMLFDMGLVGDEYMYRLARIEDVDGARMDAVKLLARKDPDVLEQALINAWRELGLLELADKRQAELDIRIQQRMAAENAPIAPPGQPGMGQPMGAPPGMNGGREMPNVR